MHDIERMVSGFMIMIIGTPAAATREAMARILRVYVRVVITAY